MTKLLILGGTSEASRLAAALAGNGRFDTLMSFAGITRAPRVPPVPYRIGGFGGAEGLAAFLRDGGFELVIDATHPFAAQMKRNAIQASVIAGVRLLGIARPAWTPGPGDRWREMGAIADAARALGEVPRRVLLTIGQKDLSAFRDTPQHHYVIRSVDPPEPEALPPDCELIAARGPFRLADELALLRRIDVSVMVTKNSGGLATEPKLEAARLLGIDVLMIARPVQPAYPEAVASAEEALAWLDAHAGTARGV
jgi:precorrin-6A/cobalt-precorrin-6A reductase